MGKDKKIALVSPFVNPFLYSNSRVLSVAEVFKKNGITPVIITTDFDHNSKKKYKKRKEESLYETILIDVPEYKKNLGIPRVISHIFFAFRVKSYFKKNLSKYSIVYCTTPSTLAPFLLSRLCNRHKVTFILDVIDLWPESYFVFFKKIDFLIKMFLFPWTLVSKLTYHQSNLVIAESKEYANYVSRFRKDKVEGYYLGVDVNHQKELIRNSTAIVPEKRDHEIWIAYGGALNNSYDFDVILSSFLLIKNQFLNAKLLFIGGGEKEMYIRKYLREFEINGLVTGILPYPDYLKWLSKCDIGINSFLENTLVAHSYKYNDYIATGCCILNNLKGETWSSVEEYCIGLNFDYKNNTLEKCFQILLAEPKLIELYKSNSIYLANNDLSKDFIYSSLYRDIKSKMNRHV